MATATDTSQPHSTSPSTWAVIALLASFVSAYVVDRVVRQLRLYAGSTFDREPYILISALLPLFVVAMILLLAYLVIQRLTPSRTVAVIYLVAGLSVAIVYVSFLVSYPLWLRATFLFTFQQDLVSYGSQSSTYYVASAWILIGAVTLRKTLTPHRGNRPLALPNNSMEPTRPAAANRV